MRATRGLPAAFLAWYALATAAPGPGAGPAAPATGAAAVSSTSSDPAPAPAPDSARARGDSLRARPNTALDDSLESRLAGLDSARVRLSGADRRVFDELMAAARELCDAGDLEAARLVLDDAQGFLEARPR